MMMHKNIVWLCFLALVFIVTLLYTGHVLAGAYRYLQLSSAAEASATAWSVEMDNDSEYVPLVKYTFQVDDKFYEGKTLFYDEKVNNPWAAEESLKSLAVKNHQVWYSPKDPMNSTLHKEFSVKEVVYVCILWILSVYFFWLGVYVAKQQR